jgi:hypothetical protein
VSCQLLGLKAPLAGCCWRPLLVPSPVNPLRILSVTGDAGVWCCCSGFSLLVIWWKRYRICLVYRWNYTYFLNNSVRVLFVALNLVGSFSETAFSPQFCDSCVYIVEGDSFSYGSIRIMGQIEELYRIRGSHSCVYESSVFRDTTLFNPLKVNRRFGGTCRLYLQGSRISRARNQHESRWQTVQLACRNFGLCRKQEGNGRQQVSTHWLSHTTEGTNRRQEQGNHTGNGRLCCWWCNQYIREVIEIGLNPNNVNRGNDFSLLNSRPSSLQDNSSAQTTQKTAPLVVETCLPLRCIATRTARTT